MGRSATSAGLMVGLMSQLCGTLFGTAGVGLGGVRSYLDFAGAGCSLFFFGFFASRPRLSRLPMILSFDANVMTVVKDTSQ
jgi:hypothetical protein